MLEWLRKNAVLAAGIALPVLLVLAFFVLNRVPALLGDPPQYDFLLVAYRYDYQRPRDFHLAFEVRDGRLHGEVIPAEDGQTHLNRQYAGLFRYRAAENRFDEIVYELPPDLDGLEEKLRFRVAETAQLQLDRNARSPDGFSFEYPGYRGRGGLLGELFGMGRRVESDYVLNRDGAHFNLPRPAPDDYYYQHDLHFMGWVIGQDSGS